jgi:superfamily II DNA or RNA helicase
MRYYLTMTDEKMQNKIILKRARLAIPKERLSKDEIIAIKRELKVRPFHVKGFGQPKKPFKCFRETEDTLYVPKYYNVGHFKYDTIKQLDEKVVSLASDVKFAGALRAEQKEPFDKVVSSIKTTGGAVLSIRCGGGKTVLALAIIAALGVKTLVVVPKEFLMKQWKERIEQFIPQARVGRIQGKVADVEDKDIVLGMINSLALKKYDRSLMRQFGFCVVDECHKTATEMFSKALPRISTRWTLGLSATPKRADGTECVFHWFLGQMAYQNSTEEHHVGVQLIPFISSSYQEKFLRDEKTPNIAAMINQIAAHSRRNALLVKRIRALVAETDRKVLLLGGRVKMLKDMCKEVQNEYKISAGLYIGGMREEALKASEAKQIIFATYKMASEGLDIKGLNTLILATPRVDIQQSVGRILRDRHSTTELLIIDIIDCFSLFKGQGKKRLKYYNRCKYDAFLAGAPWTRGKERDEGLSILGPMRHYHRVGGTKGKVVGRGRLYRWKRKLCAVRDDSADINPNDSCLFYFLKS